MWYHIMVMSGRITWHHICYHVWYGFIHSLGHVISSKWHDVIWYIMEKSQYHMTQRMGKIISHMTSYMMSCNFAWYHHYVISHNCDIIELYDVICDITCLAGLGRRLTWPDIVTELGQLIDLDQYSLDSLIDLVAFYTVSTVNRGFLEVIEEG